jgi:hypothetical protein
MKILTSITGLLFAALFILSCEKDNSNNKSGVVNLKSSVRLLPGN